MFVLVATPTDRDEQQREKAWGNTAALSFLSELTLIVVFPDTSMRVVPWLPMSFLRLNEGIDENVGGFAISEGQVLEP